MPAPEMSFPSASFSAAGEVAAAVSVEAAADVTEGRTTRADNTPSLRLARTPQRRNLSFG